MWKLKLDGEGKPVMQDGHPVYVDDATGKEQGINVDGMFTKITELNTESMNHRLQGKAALEAVAKLGDRNLDELLGLATEVQTLGGLDALKKGAKVDPEAIKAEMNRAWEAKMAEKDKLIGDKDSHIFRLEVSNKIGNSAFVKDRLTLPPQIVEKTYSENFRIEDGKVVAYGTDGKPLYSTKRPGEFADVDEALEALVMGSPYKDTILKGTGSTGSGSQQQSRSQQQGSKVIASNDPGAFGANLEAIAKGDVTVDFGLNE